MASGDITAITITHNNEYVTATWDWVAGVTPSACTYTLQRCGSENFAPAEAVETLLRRTTKKAYDDYAVTLKDLWRRFHYRVITHVSGGQDHLCESHTFNEGLQDRIVQDIRYRFELALEAVMGTPVKIFVKKIGGERCPDCWDTILQRCVKDKCETCYGTGRTGGYYAPIQTWAQLQPRDDTPSLDPQGMDQKNVVAAYFGHTPYLVYGDVIMDSDNGLYVVIRNQSTYKAGAVAHQLVTLRLLNRDSVEYKMLSTQFHMDFVADTGVPLTR